MMSFLGLQDLQKNFLLWVGIGGRNVISFICRGELEEGENSFLAVYTIENTFICGTLSACELHKFQNSTDPSILE